MLDCCQSHGCCNDKASCCWSKSELARYTSAKEQLVQARRVDRVCDSCGTAEVEKRMGGRMDLTAAHLGPFSLEDSINELEAPFCTAGLDVGVGGHCLLQLIHLASWQGRRSAGLLHSSSIRISQNCRGSIALGGGDGGGACGDIICVLWAMSG